MGKLKKLPFKVLFYLGFFIVIIFLVLSYWQLSSHYDDLNNLENLSKHENLLEITISDVNNLSEFQYIQIDETVTLFHTWLLRSRVQNGQNGYNRIDLISDSYSNYMIVNRGWVPLDFDLDSIDKSEDYKYIGARFDPNLIEYYFLRAKDENYKIEDHSCVFIFKEIVQVFM